MVHGRITTSPDGTSCIFSTKREHRRCPLRSMQFSRRLRRAASGERHRQQHYGDRSDARLLISLTLLNQRGLNEERTQIECDSIRVALVTGSVLAAGTRNAWSAFLAWNRTQVCVDRLQSLVCRVAKRRPRHDLKTRVNELAISAVSHCQFELGISQTCRMAILIGRDIPTDDAGSEWVSAG